MDSRKVSGRVETKRWPECSGIGGGRFKQMGCSSLFDIQVMKGGYGKAVFFKMPVKSKSVFNFQ